MFEYPIQFLVSFDAIRFELVPDFLVGCIHPNTFSRLRIRQVHQPDRRQYFLSTIIQLQSHHVMLLIGNNQRVFEIVIIHEIGN